MLSNSEHVLDCTALEVDANEAEFDGREVTECLSDNFHGVVGAGRGFMGSGQFLLTIPDGALGFSDRLFGVADFVFGGPNARERGVLVAANVGQPLPDLVEPSQAFTLSHIGEPPG
ncbi:hypothetical protein IU485_27775 [Nocardia cyriacigeorgica]|uniref:hypothetical protein n=1 Tax=Nocardia cyriacigeorgica TaxID=135487 RepID=UPI001895E0A6|nr:hypothetical protein [Nocardia cyriacigeorgica]MBF6085177.1 hypothetical protein [Nocardia cyriacigeorgica]